MISRLLQILLHGFGTVALVAVIGTSAMAEPPAAPRMSAPELRDHPLVGRIWRARDGTFVTPRQLAGALARANRVLLGETHDNPDHHRIQAWAVEALFAAGKRPGLALEMIPADRQEIVTRHFRDRPGDAHGLGAALDWDTTGWPPWRHYAPIVAPVAHAGLPVIGADLPRATIRAVIDKGFDALGDAQRRALGLDRLIPDAMLAVMREEIVDAHCGQIPPERAGPFARAQVARDASLADGLRRAAAGSPEGTGVLIAGAGHVRNDRAVPWHLARWDGNSPATVLTLTALEVRDRLTAPADYAATFDAERLPFDYAWFTPRQLRGDPCASFNKK